MNFCEVFKQYDIDSIFIDSNNHKWVVCGKELYNTVTTPYKGIEDYKTPIFEFYNSKEIAELDFVLYDSRHDLKIDQHVQVSNNEMWFDAHFAGLAEAGAGNGIYAWADGRTSKTGINKTYHSKGYWRLPSITRK